MQVEPAGCACGLSLGLVEERFQGSKVLPQVRQSGDSGSGRSEPCMEVVSGCACWAPGGVRVLFESESRAVERKPVGNI